MIQVEIEIHNLGSNVSTEGLVCFFEPYSHPKITYFAVAAKAELALINIIITIVGDWAAQRYILDPIADRLEDWWHGISTLEGKSFKAVIMLKNDSGEYQIEVVPTLNPLVKKSLWVYLREAIRVLDLSIKQGLKIDKVQIVPHPRETVLILGYEGKQPIWYLDRKRGIFTPIPTMQNETSLDKINLELFKLEIQRQRLEYQQSLYTSGQYENLTQEIAQGTRELEDVWQKFLGVSPNEN